MRCLCEHYLETDNGYCCLERQRLLDENAELREKLARASAEIKRLRAEPMRKGSSVICPGTNENKRGACLGSPLLYIRGEVNSRWRRTRR